MKPYFQNFSFDEIKKEMIKKIVNLGLPSAMQMLFEVVLLRLESGFVETSEKPARLANQIALSLASMTFMFAMGLSVVSMIRISTQKGLNDYKQLIIVARSIFLLAILIEIVFAVCLSPCTRFYLIYFLIWKITTSC